MDKLVVTFKTVTPLFLGGAEPNKQAELRVPSVKGAMRFWYRAIDPDYRANEPKIFGSTDEGQAKFTLRIKNHKESSTGFQKSNYGSFTDGTGTHGKNGIIYLGYPLETGSGDRGNYQQRKFIDTNEVIGLELLFKEPPDEKTRKAVLSSLWLLGHIGGLGFRCRRGFGTVSLKEMSADREKWLEIESLQPAHDTDSTKKWIEEFRKGLEVLRQWFPGQTKNDHTVFGKNTYFYLYENGSLDGNGHKAWEHAFNEAGRTMQDFRNRLGPDYQNVKNHLAKKEEQRLARENPPSTPSIVPGVTPAWLVSPPERSCFGLPLTFQYQSLNKAGYRNKSVTFLGNEHDRSASPLFIRIIEINGRCHPFFAILDVAFLAPGEKVKEQTDERGRNSKSMKPSGILADFCKVLKAKAVDMKEVPW